MCIFENTNDIISMRDRGNFVLYYNSISHKSGGRLRPETTLFFPPLIVYACTFIYLYS